ncbi:MAG TPA: glycosyltransferase family 2 protein [Conexibacter sp.]|nr:glycosyltransferase family 2 protein [Conexibacter sp.]
MVVGAGEGHRYLDRVLRLADQWADLILVYADGVDPDTRDALGARDIVAEYGETSRYRDAESDVRNQLMRMCDEELADGDLVVALDADEQLVGTGTNGNPIEDLRGAYDDHRYGRWPVLFEHIWAPDGSVIRVDGGWAPARGYRIYRHRPGARIPDRKLACLPTPPSDDRACPDECSPFRCLHWGYAHPHDRPAKHAFYVEQDGGEFHSRRHIDSILAEPTLVPTPELP